jgi:fructose-bisphosphate aldolase class I
MLEDATMNPAELARIAKAMVVKNKGILAADESTATIKKRFDSIKLESTEELRRSYRELLFTAPGAAESISGVILYDETIRQKTRDGTPFPTYLAQHGMIPGIKVDLGAKPLAGFPGETITEGLDGLRERLVEYGKLGARFAKWRAVIDIGEAIPSSFAIDANAHALARYAALCQEQEIVPIVEPEVLMDGAHSIERCEHVTDAVLQAVFGQLAQHRVYLEGMVLKPNMVISGKKARDRASPEQVAEATVRCLKRHVPPAVPGIAFLSGGQSPTEATLHLSLINQHGPLPWALTFSYGRALQDTALKAWGGASGNVSAGQQEFAKRAKLNGLATTGRYNAAVENQAA